MHKRLLIHCITFIMVALIPTLPATETKKRSKVLFVYVSYEKEKLTLVKTNLVAGSVKKKRNNGAVAADMYCEIHDNRGDSMFSQFIQCSEQIHYDYIDQNGKLTGGVTESPNGVFAVRAPYNNAMKSISFYSIKKKNKCKLNKKRNIQSKDSLIATFSLEIEEK